MVPLLLKPIYGLTPIGWGNNDRQKFLLVSNGGEVRLAKARLSVGSKFYGTVD
ncbi:hypothetical protein [Synechocystis salina]|uniref:hypothetical protein n=1 Tax=Synechocystis salina TaxID=945780 RepID=UPI00187F555D|nr:hypothetical protein [Synechocystis salina]